MLEYHIEKKADITVVCTNLNRIEETNRFGIVTTDESGRVVQFDEKPLVSSNHFVSTGVYIIRRRHLIELLEAAAEEERHNFVQDILVRYLNVKKVYAYKLNTYWNNIASIKSYYETNMDFLKKENRDYFFKTYPDVYSKVEDLPPAKYNVGSNVRNSIVASGCIINGTVENSVLFKKVYIGNNCVIKNSIILNDVFVGDNSYIENCIVESKDTIRANTNYTAREGEVRVVVENNQRYTL